jgi:hypothetical protein
VQFGPLAQKYLPKTCTRHSVLEVVVLWVIRWGSALRGSIRSIAPSPRDIFGVVMLA